MMTLGERIKLVRGQTSRDRLAPVLEVSKNTLVNYESGERTPDADFLNKFLSQYPGINPTWLLTGEGPMRRGETVPIISDHAAEYDRGQIEGEFVHVPRYEIAASAGGGAVVQSEQVVDHLAFKAEWLKVTLGMSPTQAAVISVIGDSMEPYLADGDLILVDTGINRVSNDAVYILQYEDSLLVKRIQRKGDGTVVVKSDNPRYEPESFRGAAADRLRVVGRLVRRLVR